MFAAVVGLALLKVDCKNTFKDVRCDELLSSRGHCTIIQVRTCLLYRRTADFVLHLSAIKQGSSCFVVLTSVASYQYPSKPFTDFIV